MKRVLRWFRRWWGAWVVAIALLLALYIGLAPVVARWAAVRTLEGIGLEDVQLEVSGVSPSYAEMRNVTVGGEGRVRVAAAGVTFSPGGIAHGRVRTIDLAGAEVLLKVKDGVVDFGPLAGLLAVKGSKRKANLPFARADLRSSALVLDWEGQRLRIPVRGSVENLGDGKAKLDAHIEVAGTHLRVAVTGDINTLEGEATIEGQAADFGGLLAAIPPKVAVLPGRAGGVLSFKVTVSSKAGGIEASLSAAVEGAALSTGLSGRSRALSADRIAAGGRARLAHSLALDSLTGEVRATGMRLNGETVHVAALEVKTAATAASLHVSASGEGWDVSASAADWPGPFRMPEPGTTIEIPLSARAKGILPGAIRRALNGYGINVENMGRVTVDATARAHLHRFSDEVSKWAQGESPFAWAVDPLEIKATLEPGDLSVGPAGVVLRGLKGQMQVRAWLDPWKALGFFDVFIDPRTQLSVNGMTGRWPGVELDLARGDTPGLEILPSSPWGPPSESVDPSLAEPEWRVHSDGLRVAFRRGRLVMPSSAVELGGLSGELWAAFEVNPKEVRVRLSPGAKVAVGSLAAEASGIRLVSAKAGESVATAETRGDETKFNAERRDGKVSWDAAAPEVLLRLGDQHASFAGGDVQVEGLSGAVPVTVKVEPAGGKAFALDGGSVAFKAAETMIGGIRERTGPALLGVDPDGQRPLFQLDFAPVANGAADSLPKGLPLRGGKIPEYPPEGVKPSGGAGEGVRPPGGAPAAWTVRLAASAKAKGVVDVAVGEGGSVKLGTLRTEVTFTHDSEGRIAVKSASTAEAVEGSLKAPLSAGALTASSAGGDLRLAIAGEGRSGEMSKVPWKLDFAVKTGPAKMRVPLSSGEIGVSVAQGEWSGSATVGVEPRLLDTRVAFRGGIIGHAPSGLTAWDIAGEVPVTANREGEAADGRFEIGSVALGKDKLAPLGKLAGTMRVSGWRADFAAAWPLVKGATLNAQGWVDIGRGTPQGELKAAIARFQIAEDNPPGKVLPALKGFDLRGAFTLDARLAFLGDRLDPVIRLGFEDAELASKEWDASAQGVNGAITLNGLTPLSTPGNQRIAFKSARMGQFQTRDGLVVFRLEDPHSLLVETARWGWAGGRLYTEAFRIDPQDPDINVVVYGDRLKLGEILALLPDQMAKGEGELYGRMPVRVRWPRLKFSPGFLYGTPGVKGWIQLSETPKVKETLDPAIKRVVDRTVKEVAERDPRVSKEALQTEIRKRIVDGLEDFEYAILRADFMMVEGALRPVVFLAGQGRTGARQEFKGVTLEFPVDFDKLLNGAIITKRGAVRAVEKGKVK